LNSLFASLTEAMSASLWLALSASFVWGILSILLSPCHLSSIPLIVGFLSAQNLTSAKRTLALSTLFAVGILLTIAIVGGITAAMGRMLGDVGPYGKYLVGIVFLVVGLYLMDLIKLPDLGVKLRPTQGRSAYWSALSLGLVFGMALGPCTFAFLAPVLGLVFQLASQSPMPAIGLLLAFALGHCAVIITVGVLTTRIQSYLDWSNRTKAVIWMKRIAGGLVIIGGIYAFVTAY
jgi:cytochrome c-type biogenesis protein